MTSTVPDPKSAIVVGSGASGGMVARILAKNGWQVTILEKGQNFFQDPKGPTVFQGLSGPTTVTGTLGGKNKDVQNVFSNDEVGWESRTAPINQDPLLEPRSFRSDNNAGDRSFVGDVNNLPTTVGGATLHYDAKARRYREVDFITNKLMGGSPGTSAIPEANYADWPMTYDQLEPFYAVSEEVVGVQGPAKRKDGAIYNPNPYESWRSTPYPMPPGVAQLSSLLPAEAAKRLGYHPAAVPTSVLSRPYGPKDDQRNACNDCGFCINYGCTIGAKSSGVWPLNEAIRAGATLITGANVTRILYDEPNSSNSQYHARGVEYIDSTGATQQVYAARVILANTPIEATRLSLQSGIGVNQTPGDPSEPSGMLGRNLMFHLQTAVETILDLPIHSFRGRTSTHTLDAFVGAGPSCKEFDPAIPRGGIVEIGGNLNPVSQAAEFASFLSGQAHKDLMALGPFVSRLTNFTMQGEDMPQLTNVVDLDPQIVDVYGQKVPRITYKSHPYEIAASQYYLPKMVEIMEAIGGIGSPYPIRPLMVLPISPAQPSVLPGMPGAVIQENLLGATPIGDVPASAHIMGTHRISLEHELGVCDPYGRYWAFDNLYYAGGGMQPTAPGFNVTLTFWALSYWMASAIVAGVGGQKGYTSGPDGDIQKNLPALINVLKATDPKTMIAYQL